MERTHGVTHYDPLDCFGCKILTVSVAPSAMPSRGDNAHVASANTAEAQLARDSEAFKDLREHGYNPKSINGAAALANRAETGVEIAMGKSAAELASLSPSARRGDAGARRDISKGAPEYRRRLEEAQTAMERGEFAFHNTGEGRKEGLPA